MPLENAAPGTPGFGRNIKREIAAGKPRNQAVAIAYRKSGEKRNDADDLRQLRMLRRFERLSKMLGEHRGLERLIQELRDEKHMSDSDLDDIEREYRKLSAKNDAVDFSSLRKNLDEFLQEESEEPAHKNDSSDKESKLDAALKISDAIPETLAGVSRALVKNAEGKLSKAATKNDAIGNPTEGYRFVVEGRDRETGDLVKNRYVYATSKEKALRLARASGLKDEKIIRRDDSANDDFNPLPKGTPVDFRYRSAHPKGTIAGVVKKGSTAASTEYSIRPRKEDRHPGEPATVHRHANKVRKADAFNEAYLVDCYSKKFSKHIPLTIRTKASSPEEAKRKAVKYLKSSGHSLVQVRSVRKESSTIGDAVVSKKARAHGKLNQREEAVANRTPKERKEETPRSIYLKPSSRKYPYKTRHNGEWKADPELLLAAERRAVTQGDRALAARAKRMRLRLEKDKK